MLAVLAFGSSAPVGAESTAEAAAEASSARLNAELNSSSSAEPGHAVAGVAAVFPGLVVPGAGHHVAGEYQTAHRLRVISAAGLGLVVAGVVPLWVTGANRKVIEPTVPLVLTGVGALGLSWFADVYGAATGGRQRSFGGRSSQSVSVGYAYVRDPQFDFDHFSTVAGAVELGRVRLEPSVWAAVGADNQRLRLASATRLWAGRGGTRVDAEVAATHHRFGDESFAATVAEVSVAGRLDLELVGPSLAGSFATLSTGFGYEWVDFEIDGAKTFGSGLMLSRFGYGVYLPRGGELELYYDHRRDGYAAGLSPGKRNGSGFAGHGGVRVSHPISDLFAVTASGEMGAAWLVSTALEVRWGEKR